MKSAKVDQSVWTSLSRTSCGRQVITVAERKFCDRSNR